MPLSYFLGVHSKMGIVGFLIAVGVTSFTQVKKLNVPQQYFFTYRELGGGAYVCTRLPCV